MRSLIILSFLVIVSAAAGQVHHASPIDSLKLLPHKTARPDLWLGKDKGDHFAASVFLTGMGFYAARRELHLNDNRSKNAAIGFSFSLGILKEVYDKVSKKGCVSYKDLIADMAGAGFGFALLSISSR